MFVRTVSKRAARIAQTLPSCSSSARAIGGVRLASSQIPTKKPPHRVAGGQNSMLVGSAVLGATLLLGYVFGRGENVEHAAKSTLASAAAKVDTKAPSIVKKKLEEAKDTVASHIPISSSSSSTGSQKTTPPAVSATGATEPAPSIEEDRISVTSSVSDPGSLSSSSSEISEEEEDEDPRQAAFNPETGEINWDCPCLGGMAHGVCGEQFREAFACFVYSKEEPKGQDCIEKFRGMQECFAAHPEVYGEVMGEDDDEELFGTSDDGSEYDIIEAVEKALTGDSKSS